MTLGPFKLKANLSIFHERNKYQKHREVHKRSNKQIKAILQTFPEVVDDPSAFNGTHKTTQTVGIGDIAQREVVFPDSKGIMLAHVNVSQHYCFAIKKSHL